MSRNAARGGGDGLQKPEVGRDRAVGEELIRAIQEGPLKESDGDQAMLFTAEELGQRDADLDALRRRVEHMPGEIRAEEEAIERRYRDPVVRLFPATITLLVPADGGVV